MSSLEKPLKIDLGTSALRAPAEQQDTDKAKETSLKGALEGASDLIAAMARKNSSVRFSGVDFEAEESAGRSHGWRILCQAEILNFTALRRHLGTVRAESLISDVAARIGGSFPDVRTAQVGRSLLEISFVSANAEAAAREIEEMRQLFADPITLPEGSYHLQLAFGVGISPIAEQDLIRLTETAEAALERARGEDRLVMLDLSKADMAFDKLSLMRELPEAIANGEMLMHYQPKVHIRRQSINSAEALVRWQHPTRGMIFPGDFIAIAEQAGEIASLTLWTLEQVVRDQKRLAALGYDLTLFVNISGQLLADSKFVDQAIALVRNTDAKLGFEITETAVIRDPDSAIRHLNQFADIGISLAIDDYGAGLSSLAYLKKLPAKELKIDKMFVMQLTSSNRDPLIVRSTIDLAHALDMEVTAEGVETPSALALLSVMGCDMAQGYLISRPMPLDAFHQFLVDDAHKGAEAHNASSFFRPESFWKRA